MTLLGPLFARRQFPLRHFEPAPLDFEAAREEPGELLLDQVVVEAAPAPARPEPQPWPRPVPTAGELRASIERHLRNGSARERRADAADELRNALAELRRSLA